MTAIMKTAEPGQQFPAATQETSSTAVAAQARAEVEARAIMALKRPRDMDDVRERLLKECRRPRFAQVARYQIPRAGKTIEGPSIRFAEAALRCMTNVLVQTATLYDDAEKRILRVTVTDLEANAAYSRDVTVAKTVERSSVKKDQLIVSQRLNSLGNVAYTVQASDDDLRMKEGAEVSRAVRTLFLRLLPGDVLDEAMDEIRGALKRGFDADPEAERKRHADAFAAIGVKPSELKEYLGHDLSLITAKEAEDLGALYFAIQDGETTFRAALESKRGATTNEPQPKPTEKLKVKLSKLKAASPAPALAEEIPGLIDPPADDVS